MNTRRRRSKTSSRRENDPEKHPRRENDPEKNRRRENDPEKNRARTGTRPFFAFVVALKARKR